MTKYWITFRLILSKCKEKFNSLSKAKPLCARFLGFGETEQKTDNCIQWETLIGPLTLEWISINW